MDTKRTRIDMKCEASSWPYAGHQYGPEGRSRCVLTPEHPGYHRDAWGNVFVTCPSNRIVTQFREMADGNR